MDGLAWVFPEELSDTVIHLDIKKEDRQQDLGTGEASVQGP